MRSFILLIVAYAVLVFPYFAVLLSRRKKKAPSTERQSSIAPEANGMATALELSADVEVPIFMQLGEDVDKSHRLANLNWEIASLKQERWIVFGIGVFVGLVIAAVVSALYKHW